MKEQTTHRATYPSHRGRLDHAARRPSNPHQLNDASEGAWHTASRLYTIREASDILRVSTWTLQRFIREEQLGSVKIGARRLIPDEDIERFIAERRSGRVRRGLHE